MRERPGPLVRWLAIGLLLLAVGLQVRLWVGAGGMPDVWRLRERVEAQRAENATLVERNRALAADVADLKEGREAVEERARSELGMVRPAEIFYQVVEKPGASDGKAEEK